MKPIFALLAALALTGCLLDHEREERPGRVYLVDCKHITTGDTLADPVPPIPGKDSIPCRVLD